MKLLLSSYGLGAPYFHPYFYRLPAVSMEVFGSRFVPDYPVLFLFDQFIIDKKSFERVQEGRQMGYFEEMASLINTLYHEGKLEVHDFDETLESHKDKIDASVEYDLGRIDQWSEAFDESLKKWSDFAERLHRVLDEKNISGEELSSEERFLSEALQSGHVGRGSKPLLDKNLSELLSGWRQKIDPEERKNARLLAEQYLRYVTSHLCLSDNLDAAVHDWADFEPLYRKKLVLSARVREGSQKQEASEVKRLFTIVYPDFRPKDVSSFVKIIGDPRIQSVRKLLQEAIAGRISFDERFANETFRDVLQIEKRIQYYRKVVGWLSLPLDFIPWIGTPLQKIAEEAIARPMERKAKTGKEWFYLISDISK